MLAVIKSRFIYQSKNIILMKKQENQIALIETFVEGLLKSERDQDVILAVQADATGAGTNKDCTNAQIGSCSDNEQNCHNIAGCQSSRNSRGCINGNIPITTNPLSTCTGDKC